MKSVLITIFLVCGATQIFAAPVTCPTTTYNGGTAILLSEGPESEGEPAVPFCMVPAGFGVTTIPFAFALSEVPAVTPPVLSDVVVFAPTGLITFYSDPNIPTDITFDEIQSEAAQNITTVAGTTYVIISDVGPETPDVPEPVTALLLPTGLGLIYLVRRRQRASGMSNTDCP